MADCIVEWRADDRHVGPALAKRRRIGQDRKLLKARTADIGRQVEVVVGGVRIFVGRR